MTKISKILVMACCPVSKVTQLTAPRGEYRTEFSVFSVFEIPTSVSVSVFENIGYRFGISVYRLSTTTQEHLVHAIYVR